MFLGQLKVEVYNNSQSAAVIIIKIIRNKEESKYMESRTSQRLCKNKSMEKEGEKS